MFGGYWVSGLVGIECVNLCGLVGEYWLGVFEWVGFSGWVCGN